MELLVDARLDDRLRRSSTTPTATARAAPSSRAGCASGELRSREHVVQGDIAQFPDVLLGLFRGENTGKLVLAL